MSLTRIGTIARLELLQRLRSVGWYVLLAVFGVVLLGVTLLSFAVFSGSEDTGAGVYSLVVNIVLLLVVLISPALSGSSINGDREAATLAPVQMTLARTGDVMLGKLLAAVATGGAFLAVAAPFLVIAMLSGGVTPGMLVVSLLVLAAEIVVVAAIGVGWSGLLARPLFSVTSTYLVVAALVVGTLVVFGLGGTAIRTDMTTYSREYDAGEAVCDHWEESVDVYPRYDYVWGVLAANPFVILADATPTTFSVYGNPVDAFGIIKTGVRSAQSPPNVQRWDPCAPDDEQGYPTSEEIVAGSVPSWFVGLGIQLLLAGGLFAGAWSRTRTPARRLPPGTRIA